MTRPTLCQYVAGESCLPAILNSLILLGDQKDQKLGSNTVFLRSVLNSHLIGPSAMKCVHQKLTEIAAKPFSFGEGKLMEHPAFHQVWSIEAFYFYGRLAGHFIFPHHWLHEELGKTDLF